MPNIPSIEPSSVTAGDTIQWTRSLSAYPADQGWVLNYRLINAAGHIDIAGTASGSMHSITVLPAVNPAWAPGVYDWQAFVVNAGLGGERHTIGTGRMTVRANLSAQATGFDARSQARQILESLNTAYLDAVQNRAFVMEYKVAGRQFKFATRQEWVLEITFWKREVAKEDRAARIANGLGSGKKVYVRF